MVSHEASSRLVTFDLSLPLASVVSSRGAPLVLLIPKSSRFLTHTHTPTPPQSPWTTTAARASIAAGAASSAVSVAHAVLRTPPTSSLSKSRTSNNNPCTCSPSLSRSPSHTYNNQEWCTNRRRGTAKLLRYTPKAIGDRSLLDWCQPTCRDANAYREARRAPHRTIESRETMAITP
jgi:hypothetical protein